MRRSMNAPVQTARIEVARKSKLVVQDGLLGLWQSPHGQAWIQEEQSDGWAAFWAGDLHNWPPCRARLDDVPVIPVRAGSVVIDAGGPYRRVRDQALKMGAALVISIEPAL